MVVVGGMGSLYGAIIGAALFVFAESYLQDVMGALSHLAADARLPLLPALFHPDRWLLWLGLAFVLRSISRRWGSSAEDVGGERARREAEQQVLLGRAPRRGSGSFAGNECSIVFFRLFRMGGFHLKMSPTSWRRARGEGHEVRQRRWIAGSNLAGGAGA